MQSHTILSLHFGVDVITTKKKTQCNSVKLLYVHLNSIHKITAVSRKCLGFPCSQTKLLEKNKASSVGVQS